MALLFTVIVQVILCRPVVVNMDPAPRRGLWTVHTGNPETHAATSCASRGQGRCVGASLEGEFHSRSSQYILILTERHQGMGPVPMD